MRLASAHGLRCSGGMLGALQALVSTALGLGSVSNMGLSIWVGKAKHPGATSSTGAHRIVLEQWKIKWKLNCYHIKVI